MKIRISVIVPFRNEEVYLEKCLQSLRRQDFPREAYEILVVDNGSGDRSGEIVSRYPDICLFREDRKGSYRARNRALETAQGEIIAFTDADCEVSPDWLSQIDKGMAEKNAAILLGYRSFPLGVSWPLRVFEAYENAKAEYVLNHGDPASFFAFTNNMAVRRDLFSQIGVFQTWDRAADTEFLHRCLKEVPEAKIVFLPDMKVFHLEIIHVRQWFRKLRLYGQSNQDVEKISGYRRLGMKAKWRIFKTALQKRNVSMPRGLTALFLLAIGNGFYQAGVLKSKISANK